MGKRVFESAAVKLLLLLVLLFVLITPSSFAQQPDRPIFDPYGPGDGRQPIGERRVGEEERGVGDEERAGRGRGRPQDDKRDPAPQSDRQKPFSVELKPLCDTNVLARNVHAWQDEEKVARSARLIGDQLLILAAESVLADLRRLPCVAGTRPGWLPEANPADQPQPQEQQPTKEELPASKSTLPQQESPPQREQARPEPIIESPTDPAPNRAPTALTATGQITGTVTAEDGGALLNGIYVQAYSFDGSSWNYYGYDYTDSNGQYDLAGLAADTYRVRFTDYNYYNYLEEYYDDARNIDGATDIVVADGGIITGIDAALTVGSHITGTVTMEGSGAALTDISVNAYQFDGSWWDSVAYDNTDSNGLYDLSGLAAGTYRVRFYDYNGAYLGEYFDDVEIVEDGTDIVVAASSTIANIDAALAQGSHITGTVTMDGSGVALTDISVTAYEYNGSWWDSVAYDNTDSNGLYDLGGLAAGTYRVGFYDYNGAYLGEYFDDVEIVEDGTDIVVAASSTIANIDAALAQGSHITGTVTMDGSGLAIANISVYAYEYNGSWWDSVAYDNTDSNGQYDLGGLTAGTYRVQFYDSSGVYLSEYYDNAGDIDSAADIVVAAASTTTGIDAALGVGGHITGTVTAEDGGAPLPYIGIELYFDNGVGWDYAGYGSTDQAGFYDVGGLKSGLYRVGFFDWNTYTYLDEYYDNVTDFELAADISVTVGQTVENIDAALVTGGTISGIITADGSGLPLANIEVCAYFDGAFWAADCAYTNAGGSYEIGGLQSGPYRVGFFDYNGDHLGEYYDDAIDLYTAADISVTAGSAITGINASLASAGHISGFVTAEDGGAALPSIYVEVYQFVDYYWDYVGNDYTDGSGYYDVGSLGTGIYRVGFFDYDSGAYAGEYYDDMPNLHTAADISVTAGSTTSGIDAALTAAGHISGNVTADGGGPLPNISIEVYPYDGSENDSVGYGSTNSSGFYDIGGLPAGSYRVRFYDTYNYVYITEYYDDVLQFGNATAVAVSAGSTTSGIDAALVEGGHISGTVTAAGSGTAIPSISVDVYSFNGSYWDYVDSGYTDANGFYDVGRLPAGTYRVGFFDFNNNIYLEEYYSGAPDLNSAADISVTAGLTTSGIDAALVEGGYVSGSVTSADGGAPLESISVWAYLQNPYGWQSIGYGYTDAAGFYTISGLPTGTYYVGFFDWDANNYIDEYYDDAPDIDSAADVAVTAGSTTENIDAAMTVAGHITGTVTAEDSGLPLANIEVTAYLFDGSRWQYMSYGMTDANGYYDIGRLSSGTYRVGFVDYNTESYLDEYYDDVAGIENALDISVTAGSTTTGIDAALAVAGRIAGTVTAEDTGDPLAYIDIDIYRFNGSFWGSVAYGDTNINGDFDIGRLPSGTYRIRFEDWDGTYLEEYYDNAPDILSAADIGVVTGATTTGIDAALATAGHISGIITDEISGTALVDISACAYAYNGASWVFAGTCGYSSAGGGYDIGGLPTGNYRVRFRDGSGTYVTEYYDDAPDLDSAVDIAVTAPIITPGIDAALGKAGHISGTVTADNGGLPLEGITVCARYDNGSFWETAGSCYTTAADGSYEIRSLLPGPYRIGFWDNSGLYVGEYYDDVSHILDATDVEVTAGLTTANIDAGLADGGHITGTVTIEADGTPLSGIVACAHWDNGSYWEYKGFCGTSDGNGDYIIDGLPGGAFRVSFRDFNGVYKMEYFDNVDDVDSATDIALSVGGTTAGIDAALALGGHITGTVTAGVGGPALPGINVCAYYYDGVNWQYMSLCDDTDSSGQYDVGGLYTGLFRLRFHDYDGNYRTEYYDDAVDIGSGVDIPVTAGSTTAAIDAALQWDAATTQQIPLSAGWNMISSTVDPADPALETLLAGIESNMVLLKDGQGAVYWPALFINDIGSWDVRDGYQIFMNNPATLSITGQPVDPAVTSVDLQPGWNLFAYLRQSPMQVDLALAGISGDLMLVKNGLGEVYWPTYSVNQIGDMQTGKGYMVYMNNAGTVTYPPN